MRNGLRGEGCETGCGVRVAKRVAGCEKWYYLVLLWLFRMHLKYHSFRKVFSTPTGKNIFIHSWPLLPDKSVGYFHQVAPGFSTFLFAHGAIHGLMVSRFIERLFFEIGFVEVHEGCSVRSYGTGCGVAGREKIPSTFETSVIQGGLKMKSSLCHKHRSYLQPLFSRVRLSLDQVGPGS